MKRFLKNSSGVAAIEFAILLPFLLIVFYGAFQVTMFVSTVRKIDNVANDIGYILSREGFITAKNPDGSARTPYTGGKAQLENVFKNTIPFLLGSNAYNPDDFRSDVAQIYVKYVGLPRFQDIDPTGGCTPANPNQTTLRLMWAHAYPSISTNTATKSIGSASSCVGALCPKSCNNNNYLSFYSEAGYNERANITSVGQSFILVNFAGRFDALFNGFPGIGFVFPNKIEKVSTYAVRGRFTDLNGNNIVDAGELRNQMHYCTDCSLPSNTAVNGLAIGNGPLRQTCVPEALLNVNNRPSGGCDFY